MTRLPCDENPPQPFAADLKMLTPSTQLWQACPLRYPCSSLCEQQTVSTAFILNSAKTPPAHALPSFAFVEYEDRRDAEDAYHEMHNKRIGRDDLLKIEVRLYIILRLRPMLTDHSDASGLALLRLRLGALTLVVTAIAALLVLPAVGLPVLAVPAITPLARMTAVTVTATTTATAVTLVTALAPLIVGR